MCLQAISSHGIDMFSLIISVSAPEGLTSIQLIHLYQ